MDERLHGFYNRKNDGKYKWEYIGLFSHRSVQLILYYVTRPTENNINGLFSFCSINVRIARLIVEKFFATVL